MEPQADFRNADPRRQPQRKGATWTAFENVLLPKNAHDLLGQAHVIGERLEDGMHAVRTAGYQAAHSGSHLFAAIGVLAGGVQGLELATGAGGSVSTGIESLIFAVGALKLGHFVERKRNEMHFARDKKLAARHAARPTLADLGAPRPQGTHPQQDRDLARDPRLPDMDVWPQRADYDIALDGPSQYAEPTLDDAPTETIKRPGDDLWGELDL